MISSARNSDGLPIGINGPAPSDLHLPGFDFRFLVGMAGGSTATNARGTRESTRGIYHFA